MLRPAIALEKAELPQDLRDEIARLAGPRPFMFTWLLVRTWAVIVGAIVLATWVGTWWSAALAVVLIGIRQSMLAVLVHEQVHLLGYRKGAGDLLVNLFCAFPLLFLTSEGYAQIHLAHHRHYFTDKDPDHRRKSGEEWRYPKSVAAFARLLLRDLTALNFLRLVRGKRSAEVAREFSRPGFNPPWARPIYFICLSAVLTATGSWGPFLLYWVLPLFTVLQVVIRWGAVCEHEYNRPGARVADSTPLIVPPWWQLLLLPTLNFNLHIYHHYFPGIACSNLPRVHALFVRRGLVDDTAVFHGYGAYLRHLFGGAADPIRAPVNAPVG